MLCAHAKIAAYTARHIYSKACGHAESCHCSCTCTRLSGVTHCACFCLSHFTSPIWTHGQLGAMRLAGYGTWLAAEATFLLVTKSKVQLLLCPSKACNNIIIILEYIIIKQLGLSLHNLPTSCCALLLITCHVQRQEKRHMSLWSAHGSLIDLRPYPCSSNSAPNSGPLPGSAC